MKNPVLPFPKAGDGAAQDAENKLRDAASENLEAVALDHTPEHLVKLAIQLGQALDAHQAKRSKPEPTSVKPAPGSEE